MIESGSQPVWVSVAEAARALEITETAVRKRIRVGALSARGDRGATEVLLSVENQPGIRTQPVLRGSPNEASGDAALLAGEVAELRARLADAQLDRDRWHAAATEARQDARAATAARDAAERELRMLLAQT